MKLLSISFLGETRWGRVSFDTMAGRTGDLGRIEQQLTCPEMPGVAVADGEARPAPPVTGCRRKTCMAGPPSSHESWLSGAVQRCQQTDKTFPRITAHGLRHTAASLAIHAGANPKVVQRMLGHASAAMTLDVYADLFDSDLDTVAVTVSKMWPRQAN